MKKFILITGVAGNIGSSLALGLLKKNYKILGIDNFLTGSKKKLPISKNFYFIKGNVNDFSFISKVFKKYNFSIIFHFAAVVGVKRTLGNPLMVLNDIEGIKNLLNLSVQFKIKKFFYSSSSEIYGEPVSLPLHEINSPFNSKLPYSVVKNISENFIKSYNQVFNLNFTIFRFFNTYGPNQSEDFVIPKFINAALKGLDIEIYGDGNQTRTFLYIDDNVDTMIKCLEQNFYVNDVINIGSSKEYKIKDLAKMIIKITNSKSKLVHMPPLKNGDMRRRRPNNLKMKKILDRKLISLNSGLKKYINYIS